MPILKSRYKLYGFCTGIFIIAITTIIGILIEKFSDKDMVHLNVQMYISLISCIFIGISTLHLTWNIFVAIYFHRNTGIWLFNLILWELILMVNSITGKNYWLISLVTLNMVLIFLLMIFISNFHDHWKEWREENSTELYLWQVIYGQSITSRNVQNYRIPLTGSLIFPSSHAFILNDYGSDNYDWEWDFTYFTENEEFAWTVYSQSLTGSIDTLYSKVLEEYYGKLNKKEGNSLTYTCMNETNMDEECISHESVENVVSPTNSDDGNSESK
ncbi:uncharacterized protein LOC130898584 isoform X1 [Diorhabda carinulata]|uniref:uncharacterized protein LOC130898584 isoform X1 n=1 Tax=Diorhabda carinulata TaxID=1163345 RepID=UPI0025A1B5B2|nr:uncharacterized protein LOC130898584 isoform X1 [Diorhabda carinulata]